jgi:hemerythrin
MIVWNEDYETGFKRVDEQHRELIDVLNSLEKTLAGPLPPRSACDELMAFLARHVATHFSYEEDCMHRARCPAHESNKRAHQAFLALFAQYSTSYEAQGPSRELLSSLHRAACDWVRGHILNIDSKLRMCSPEVMLPALAHRS